MARIEDLEGILGKFEGKLRRHPNFKQRGLADGILTYERPTTEGVVITTIPVENVRVRRLHGQGITDFRRYIRVERGPKEDRDKIIGLIDND